MCLLAVGSLALNTVAIPTKPNKATLKVKTTGKIIEIKDPKKIQEIENMLTETLNNASNQVEKTFKELENQNNNVMGTFFGNMQSFNLFSSGITNNNVEGTMTVIENGQQKVFKLDDVQDIRYPEKKSIFTWTNAAIMAGIGACLWYAYKWYTR